MSESSQSSIGKKSNTQEVVINLDKDIWGYAELAHYLRYKVSTLQTMKSRKRYALPPTIDELDSPRWHRDEVKAFYRANPLYNRKKAGRPRHPH